MVAFIVVPSIGVAKYLTTESTSQTNNQAECISKRPPPVSCQVPIVTTTTTTNPPPTSSTSTTPPSSTSTTSTTASPPGTAAWDASATTWDKSTNVIALKQTLERPDGTPLVGATIVFRLVITPGGQSFAATCTSDVTGVCQTTFDVPVGVTNVSVTVASISSVPPISIWPTTLDLTPQP